MRRTWTAVGHLDGKEMVEVGVQQGGVETGGDGLPHTSEGGRLHMVDVLRVYKEVSEVEEEKVESAQL